MYALKRHKTKVSTPCRLLIRSFRDFHNINLCSVCCLFKQINLTMCNKGFLKAKKVCRALFCLHRMRALEA